MLRNHILPFIDDPTSIEIDIIAYKLTFLHCRYIQENNSTISDLFTITNLLNNISNVWATNDLDNSIYMMKALIILLQNFLEKF